MKRFALLLGCALAGPVSAQSEWAGDWMLELEVPSGDVYALLQLERTGESWAGYVEGGPVDVEIDGDQLEVVVDSRDIAGFLFERRLTGRLRDDVVTGTVSVVDQPESAENGSPWTARRASADDTASEGKPFDVAGTWVPARGADIRKYSMALTPEARAWHEDYILHLDQPNVRCVSAGLVAVIAWASYPSEWLVDDDRITIIYEVASEVRRVYLDGREAPDYFPPSPMGWSNGRWEGDALVIETTHLAPNVRDFLGEPISENARFVERYTLSEEGNRLSAVMTLHDPENYQRPPIRRRQWDRTPDAVILPYECDPDSFFRQLHEEGRMQEYMDRAHRRL